ncbi:unnamed protein product [Calicophoron daubneyi]|uniref:Msx2-interacting protein n=1 Tax=Calicophoron daubneyi TaxID=300641 RepID=A0AAV2TD93_CALDB
MFDGPCCVVGGSLIDEHGINSSTSSWIEPCYETVCHGKIQSVRLHTDGVARGAVVAFVDTKSATRAIESTVRLNKVVLSLQYCESSGVPGTTGQDVSSTSSDSSKANNSSLLLHEDAQVVAENLSDSGLPSRELEKRSKSHARPHGCMTPRILANSMDSNSTSATSLSRYTHEKRGLHIRHLPLRSSDTNLREGLFHEYKKHGKITSVVIHGQGEERFCIITFKRSEDAGRAFEVSRGKVFFGTPISVSLHEGLDSEDPDLCPPEHALDEYHPKATKTLFVGNLNSSTITQDELRRCFRVYGEIIEIDIKIQANQPGTSYAFVQYSDIKSVVRALSNQDAIRVGGKTVKLGFGKSQPTNVVWLDNLAPTVNEAFLTRQFRRYGHLTHVVLDKKALRALLYFDKVEMAQRALNETRNRALIGRKVQLDYAGYECQVAFMRRLAKHDGFGQVYDNYRERLQEILSLWPPYGGVLPLFDRQRYLGDIQRDNSNIPSDDGSTSSFQRRSNKHLVSVDRLSNTEHTSSRERGNSLDSTHGRSHSIKNNAPLKPGSTSRQRNIGDTSAENSPSAILGRSATKSHRKRFITASPNSRPSDASHVSAEEGSRVDAHPRNYCPVKSSSPTDTNNSQHWLVNRHAPPAKSNRVVHVSSGLREGNHYLDETDDVSSGSFSPDLDACENSPESSPVRLHNQNSRSPPQFDGDSRDVSSGSSDRKRGSAYFLAARESRTHNYDPGLHTSPPLDSRRLSRKKRNEGPSPSLLHSPPTRTSVSRTLLDTGSALGTEFSRTDVTDDAARARRKSVSRERLVETTLRKSQKPDHFHRRTRPLNLDGTREDISERLISGQERGTSVSLYSSLKASLRPGGQPSYSIPSSSDEAKPGDYRQQLVKDRGHELTTSSTPNDTLTKLEIERAKLLRELSLLNNEVVGGGKARPSANLMRKRTPSRTLQMNEAAPKSRHEEFGHMQDNLAEFRRLPVADTLSQQRSSIDAVDTFSHRTENESSGMQPPTLPPNSASVNGCHSSSSEPGELFSPLPVENPTISPVASPSTRPVDTRISSKSNEATSPLSSAAPADAGFPTSQRGMLITSSPRILMPPEPTSPLTRLSSPGSPLLPVKISSLATDSSVTSNPSFSTLLSPKLSTASATGVLASPPSGVGSTSSLSSSRDPRLAQHTGQTLTDIPPPPPENLKLPLWVDTSIHSEGSLSAKSFVTPVTTKQHSSSVVKLDLPTLGGNDSEHETSSSHDASGCSLDERIRLLDAQLLRSEKARPAVDYSKFRIKRKSDALSSGIAESSSVIGASNNSDVKPTAGVGGVTLTGTLSRVLEESLVCGRGDGAVVSECSTVPATSVGFVPNSPTNSLLTLPFSVPRPADTSEFVKSMLFSSKPSPSTPTEERIAISSTLDSGSRHLSYHCPTPPGIGNTNPLENLLSACSAQPPSSGLTSRQVGSVNSRYFPSNCGVGHVGVNGPQPVGVATRLPSTSQTAPSSTVEALPSKCAENSSLPVKSILKREAIQPSTPSISRSPLADSVLSIKTEMRLSVCNSPHKYDASNESDLKADKSGDIVPAKLLAHPLKTSSGNLTSSVRLGVSASKKATTKTTSCVKRKLPPSTLESSKPLSGSKTQRRNMPRPTLDDSVFKSSLESPGPRPDRTKRPRLDSHGLLSTAEKNHTLSRPNALLNSGQTMKDGGDAHDSRRNTTQAPNQWKRENNLAERTPLFEKHGCVTFNRTQSVENGKLTNKLNTTQSSSKRNAPAGIRRTTLISTKRKVREGKKRPLDSGDSDWEPDVADTSKLLSDTPVDVNPITEGYESMYDKIKRRTSKSADKSSTNTTADTIQCVNRSTQKKHKKQNFNRKSECIDKPSGADSDTDECLSDGSSEADAPKARRNSRSGRLASQSRTVEYSDKMTKQKIPIAAQHKQTTQSTILNKNGGHITKKRKLADNAHSGKSKHLAPPMLENKGQHKINSKPFICSSPKKGNKTTEVTVGSSSVDIPNIRSSSERRKNPVTRVRKDSGQMSDLSSECSIQKKRVKSVSARKTHSLVHRVFASTDSDTPSSLSSSDGLECTEHLNNSSSREKSSKNSSACSVQRSPSPLSRCSTPRISRSCSPDDLGADAAIRHTFGAFNSSFGSKQKSDHVGGQTKVEETSENPASLFKPTPPTLPMFDSSTSGDHLSDSTARAQGRDSAEWNMFTSLGNNPLPTTEGFPVASSPTSVCEAGTKNISDEHDGEVRKVHSDLEDELPSLEKHEEDDYGKLSSTSIVLNESLLPQEDKLNTNDDDLPPPVVAALDLSPHHLSCSECPGPVSSAPASDVIEEVVYDSLEIQVPATEVVPIESTVEDPDSKSQDSPQRNSSHANTEVKCEESTSLEIQPKIFIPAPPTNGAAGLDNTTTNIPLTVCSLTSVSSVSTLASHTSRPATPLSLQSAVLGPFTVLASAAQPNELSKVGQPMLVTVPGPVAGNSLTSGLTLLPASIPVCSGPSAPSSTAQRHVTLLVPATSVSLSGSLLTSGQNLASTAVFAAPTLCSEPGPDTSVRLSSLSMAPELRTPHTVTNVCVKDGNQEVRSTNKTAFTLTVTKPGAVTVTTACLESSLSDASVPVNSTGTANSVTFDPSDFTSYVQRVIERVKQEKDEEILHQREKAKRPKKVTTAVVTIPCSVATCSNTGLLTVVPNPSISSVSPFPLIAPMPTIPGVSVCPKPPTTSAQSAEKFCVQPPTDSRVSLPPSRKPCEVAELKTESALNQSNGYRSKESIVSRVGIDQTNPSVEVSSKIEHETPIEASEVTVSEIPAKPAHRDTVDEVIDAVLSGQFDESEYLQKLLKGTFDHSIALYRGMLQSPSHMVCDTGGLLPNSGEDSAKLDREVEQERTPSSPVSISDATIKAPAPSADLKATDSSASVLTPMHVLTFVAAGAAASVAAQLPHSSAVSPVIATTSTGTQAVTETFSAVTPTVRPPSSGECQTPVSGYVGGLPVESSVPGKSATRIEHLAAHLVSNPFTSYFYSLLAQQQQLSTVPDSAVSHSSVSAKSSNSSLPTSLPSALETSLKSLTMSAISSPNDTADYLAAAATMAAMAAMASPSRLVNGAVPDTTTTTSKTSTFSAISQEQPHLWPTDPYITQSYPVIWQGRLSLKNEEVHVQMHYLSGNQNLLKSCMGVIAEQQSVSGNSVNPNSVLNSNNSNFQAPTEGLPTQLLRIVQRMRLEASQLEGVQRKLRQMNDFCMCLALACAPPATTETTLPSERARMNQILCDTFIKYMVDKSAAGIINVCHPCTQQNLFVIHIFPPCEFARDQLDATAPALSRQLTQNSTPSLLIIITTV